LQVLLSARLRGRGGGAVESGKEKRDEMKKVWLDNSDDDGTVAIMKVVLRSRSRSHQQVENDIFEANSKN
jgi:hypothetical protein